MAFNRKQKLRDNIEAIRTAFTLEREQRTPTARERVLLERYCGFGGLKCILNPARELTDAVHWAKSDLDLFAPTIELHRLIRENSRDEREYKSYVDSLKSSVLTAFYTPAEITGAITEALYDRKVRPDHVLEPSAGTGAFVDAVLQYQPQADVMAFEKDLLTGKLLGCLYPEQKIRTMGFEKIEKPFLNHFDLAISNIPFGDFGVFDAEFSRSASFGRRSAQKAIHDYFFLKGLDAVRDGGIVAFITSQGVLNSSKVSVRNEMFCKANLVSAIRLPNNLFTDNAGTEAGSDLIILQKDLQKKELTQEERVLTIIQTEHNGGLTENAYFAYHTERIVHTDAKRGTDPYGKPAMIYTHSGGVEGIATDLGRMLAEDLRKRLDMELYHGRRTAAEQTVQSAMSISMPETETVKAERSVPEPDPVRQQPENRDAATEEKAQPVTERQETGTHEPGQAPTVQLTLFDLWEYTEEERNQALSGKKKKSAAKSKDKNGKKQAQVTPKVTDEPAAAPAVSPQKETEGEKAEDVKTEDAESKETAAQAHPDDIYADIDWEENPPINGFYETMMHLTPEVRIQLRHEAEKHRQELLAKFGMKDTLDPAFVPSSDSRPVQQADMTHGSEQAPEDESPLPEGMTATAENPSVQSGQTGTTSASLFPEYDTEPAKEETADLTPHPYSGMVEAYHRDGSMVAEGTTVGYLRDITPYGATFHPLDLKGYQKEKALLYISIRRL